MDEIGVGQQVGEGKCCVCADSVLCVGWMEDGPRAAERRWKGQVEDLRMYSSHQDAVGIHGEAIEFEWTFFPGFSTLSSFQEIQKDLAEKNIEPENFQDRIIFMSIFNDILWKTGDEKCILNAERVKNYAKKTYQDMGHFWVQGRTRDGKANLTITKDSGIAHPTKWYRDSRNVVILCSKVPVHRIVGS